MPTSPLDRQAAYQLGLCWSDAASTMRRALEQRREPSDRHHLDAAATACRILADELSHPTEDLLARRVLRLFAADYSRPALADLLSRSARVLASVGAAPGGLDAPLRARASEIHEFLSHAYFMLLWELAVPPRHAAS